MFGIIANTDIYLELLTFTTDEKLPFGGHPHTIDQGANFESASCFLRQLQYHDEVVPIDGLLGVRHE